MQNYPLENPEHAPDLDLICETVGGPLILRCASESGNKSVNIL